MDALNDWMWKMWMWIYQWIYVSISLYYYCTSIMLCTFFYLLSELDCDGECEKCKNERVIETHNLTCKIKN